MTCLIKSLEDERGDDYTRLGYEHQHNQWRRMRLQIDLQSQQRSHRLSRAAWLRGRWLEVSEQERRAQLHNQKLLQDFQRAQDTLDDMVARTEAMNTIRRLQKHLKNYVQQMEDDQGIKAEHGSQTTAHPLSYNLPHQSQLPTSHTLLTTHQTDKDTRCQQNDHSYLPPTWLTGSQPLISGLPQTNIPKDYKNLHNVQALSHHLPPCYSLPCHSHHQSHSPVQQKSSSINHMYQNPWAGIRHTGRFTPTGASWPQLPVLNPMAWGMMDVPDRGVERTQCNETENTAKEMLKPSEESNQRLKHKRKGRERDQSFELDCRPVRLLIDNEDSSEGSALSSEVVKVPVSGRKETRKKRRDRTESQSTANGRKSQSSSTVSHDADPKKSKKTSTETEKDNRKEAMIIKNDTDAVKQDEEDEQEESSHAGSDKSDGTERLSKTNSGEEEDKDEEENSHELIAEEKVSDTNGVEEGDEEKVEGIDDEDGSEGNRGEHSDGEEGERDVPDNIPDSEDEADEPERQTEKNSSQDEFVKEVRGTRGGTLKTARKDENESDEEESDDNEGNIQITNNSLKELYGDDETEDEEVYNQEIEDDDDDEIVVEQTYPWIKEPLYDQTKSNDDDNEDIEDLLNPHVNSQTQQEDDAETDQPNDILSDSEDTREVPKKCVPAATNKPAESDDEFDHFYD